MSTDFLSTTDVDVDGATLLDELCSAIVYYVVLPDRYTVDAVALWIAATHAIDAFATAPRIIIRSAIKGSGKSRLLDIVGATCARPLPCADATVAAIFRCIGDKQPPTLLFDEADALWSSKIAAERNDQLRALINAGFQRGRPALRCVGPSQKVVEFPSFAMVALCGLAVSTPDTITSRSIIITMRRKLPAERCAPFRESRDGPALGDLRGRLAAWVTSQLDTLDKADPALPVTDRAADLWAPLVAVADAAGGSWPERARQAAQYFTRIGADEDSESLVVRLLGDIRAQWPVGDFVGSAALVMALRSVDDGPWGLGEEDLTVRKLANRLRPLGIHSTSTGNLRGYTREMFAEPWSRYLPP